MLAVMSRASGIVKELLVEEGDAVEEGEVLAELTTSFDGVPAPLHQTTWATERAMEFVAEEDEAKPYSDQKLAELLTEDGVTVARRTVAKYREAMAIPPSNERKRLA